jgi:hypothetical protein
MSKPTLVAIYARVSTSEQDPRYRLNRGIQTRNYHRACVCAGLANARAKGRSLTANTGQPLVFLLRCRESP